jgi:hypothetical protein
MGKHSQVAQQKRADISDAHLKSELEAHAGVRGDVTIFERSLCVSVSVNKSAADPEGIIKIIENWDYGHTPVGGWVLKFSEDSPTVARRRDLEFMREV